jgi:hypothetical protein
MMLALYITSIGGIGGLLVDVVIIAAAIAIVLIACRAFGVSIPPWVIQIFWVCVVAVVAVVAIRFVLSL